MKNEENNKEPADVSVRNNVMLGFFRDVSHEENLRNGVSFYAAGIIDEIHDYMSASGKDLCVRYIDPFTGNVNCEWRATEDVEIFQVEEHQYNELRRILDSIDT